MQKAERDGGDDCAWTRKFGLLLKLGDEFLKQH